MSFRLVLGQPAPGVQRRRIPRALVVLLGFQAFLWGGGSIIEAKAAAESLSRHSHVEDQSTTACPPIHSHLDCLICRTMSGTGGTGSAPALIPTASQVAERPASDVVVLRETRIVGPTGLARATQR